MSNQVSSDFCKSDLQELIKVSDYAAGNANKVCIDFTNASGWKLFWDAKISEEDPWYYFFALTPSNRDEVLAEIKIYQDFYDEDFLQTIKNVQTQRDTDHSKKIKNLKNKLSDLLKKATVGKTTTKSSAIYKLHRFFIQEHEKVKTMIERVELQVVNAGWQKSKQCIDNLLVVVKSNEEKMTKMSEDIKNWKEQLLNQEQQNEKLLKSNTEMKENQEKLMKLLEKRDEERLLESQKANEQQQELGKCIEQMKEEQSSERTKASQQQKELMECIQQMQKLQLSENIKAHEKQNELLACITKMQEQQNILLKENATIKMKLETMASDPGSSQQRETYFIS